MGPKERNVGRCELLIALGQRKDGTLRSGDRVPYHGVDGVKAPWSWSVDEKSKFKSRMSRADVDSHRQTLRWLKGLIRPWLARHCVPLLQCTNTFPPNSSTKPPTKRWGALSFQFIYHWRCNAERPECSNNATIYPLGNITNRIASLGLIIWPLRC